MPPVKASGTHRPEIHSNVKNNDTNFISKSTVVQRAHTAQPQHDIAAKCSLQPVETTEAPGWVFLSSSSAIMWLPSSPRSPEVTHFGDKTSQTWCIACMFCHPGTFCQHVVTKCVERFSSCTIWQSFASTTVICLYSSLDVCVCVCPHAHTRARMNARTSTLSSKPLPSPASWRTSFRALRNESWGKIWKTE